VVRAVPSPNETLVHQEAEVLGRDHRRTGPRSAQDPISLVAVATMSADQDQDQEPDQEQARDPDPHPVRRVGAKVDETYVGEFPEPPVVYPDWWPEEWK
jgi:hypothetical protein